MQRFPRFTHRGGVGVALVLAGLVATVPAWSAGMRDQSSSTALVASCNGTTCTETFSFTGAAQSWAVPAGVTSATFDVFGAQGGSSNGGVGGLGGEATAPISVTSGGTVQIMVGGAGGHYGQFLGDFGSGLGGFNGGGDSGAGGTGSEDNGGVAAGGGGGSDVRTGPCAGSLSCDFADRALVAGGGGGASISCCGLSPHPAGGAGGNPNGGNGDNGIFSGAGGGVGGAQNATGGTGGTGAPAVLCSAGGDGVDGVLGVGGTGGTGGDDVGGPFGCEPGGGGGGGYYGGGGGGGGSDGSPGAGGGGSSFGPGVASFQNGVRSGGGQVTVTYAQTANLQISKGASPNAVKSTAKPPGQKVTYTIGVHNYGPEAAPGTTVTDALPAAARFVSVSIGGCTTPPVGTNGAVICNLGTLANGASTSFQIVAQIVSPKKATVTNTATVASSVVDPVSANNSASAQIAVK